MPTKSFELKGDSSYRDSSYREFTVYMSEMRVSKSNRTQSMRPNKNWVVCENPGGQKKCTRQAGIFF